MSFILSPIEIRSIYKFSKQKKQILLAFLKTMFFGLNFPLQARSSRHGVRDPTQVILDFELIQHC